MEKWEDIKGYDGLYQVSNLGRVKSLSRSVKTKGGSERLLNGQLLKQSETNDGYLFVGLSKKGVQKKYFVHRLVANAFLNIGEPHLEINHLNENKQDNSVANLQWCTRLENANYGLRNSKISKANKGRDNSYLNVSVAQYDREGVLLEIWNSLTHVNKELGFAMSNISACCRGKIPTAYGYKWIYV